MNNELYNNVVRNVTTLIRESLRLLAITLWLLGVDKKS